MYIYKLINAKSKRPELSFDKLVRTYSSRTNFNYLLRQRTCTRITLCKLPGEKKSDEILRKIFRTTEASYIGT